VGESEVISNVLDLFQHDSVWLEHRVDITSHAGGIVGQGHGGAANDEYICDDTPGGPGARQAQ